MPRSRASQPPIPRTRIPSTSPLRFLPVETTSPPPTLQPTLSRVSRLVLVVKAVTELQPAKRLLATPKALPSLAPVLYNAQSHQSLPIANPTRPSFNLPLRSVIVVVNQDGPPVTAQSVVPVTPSAYFECIHCCGCNILEAVNGTMVSYGGSDMDSHSRGWIAF
jgi:hypothetical protein